MQFRRKDRRTNEIKIKIAILSYKIHTINSVCCKLHRHIYAIALIYFIDKDFCDHSEWIIKDEHDMVNLKFKVRNMNPMIMHALVVNIDYYVAFGELKGYVRDEDGKKYVLDGMMGMGEDKTLLL